MKLLLLKRKVLSLGACLLCAAAMFYIVSHPAVVGAAATTRQLPIYCVQRDQKVVSLSFDAAWGNAKVRRSHAMFEAHPFIKNFNFRFYTGLAIYLALFRQDG